MTNKDFKTVRKAYADTVASAMKQGKREAEPLNFSMRQTEEIKFPSGQSNDRAYQPQNWKPIQTEFEKQIQNQSFSSDFTKKQTEDASWIFSEETKQKIDKLPEMDYTGDGWEQTDTPDYEFYLDEKNQLNSRPIASKTYAAGTTLSPAPRQQYVALRDYVEGIGGSVRWDESTDTAWVRLAEGQPEQPFRVGGQSAGYYNEEGSLMAWENSIWEMMGIQSVEKDPPVSFSVSERQAKNGERILDLFLPAVGLTVSLAAPQVGVPASIAEMLISKGVPFAAATVASSVLEALSEIFLEENRDPILSGNYRSERVRVYGDRYAYEAIFTTRPDGSVYITKKQPVTEFSTDVTRTWQYR